MHHKAMELRKSVSGPKPYLPFALPDLLTTPLLSPSPSGSLNDEAKYRSPILSPHENQIVEIKKLLEKIRHAQHELLQKEEGVFDESEEEQEKFYGYFLSARDVLYFVLKDLNSSFLFASALSVSLAADKYEKGMRSVWNIISYTNLANSELICRTALAVIDPTDSANNSRYLRVCGHVSGQRNGLGYALCAFACALVMGAAIAACVVTSGGMVVLGIACVAGIGALVSAKFSYEGRRQGFAEAACGFYKNVSLHQESTAAVIRESKNQP